MASETEIENQLNSVLHKAAEKLNLRNYKLNLNVKANRGDGFLGEFFKASIVDNDTEIHLALKKAPIRPKQREENPIEKIYKNEILFYSEVYPVFLKFEQENKVPKPFTSLPEYITSCGEICREIIVLKDITFDGFELREKNLQLDNEHAELIFKTYGHYHSISFCLKEKQPKIYEKLTSQFHDIFADFINNEGFTKAIVQTAQECLDSLDFEKDTHLRNKFQKYVDHTMILFNESLKYKGKHCAILHGDCWSNNMMFKYKGPNHSELEDMKLLDFQIVRVGTPIYDLSYFFYTGGSKELFDKLEHYLDIYYQSFSKSARNLGCDPEVLLPRKILSEEWQLYSKFGMLMSIILIKIKLISKEGAIELIEASAGEKKDDGEHVFNKLAYNKNEFNNRVHDLLEHMNEINAL